MKKYILLLAILISGHYAFAQQDNAHGAMPVSVVEKKSGGPEIQWVSFEEAVKLSEKEPRKILIDVYTKWCGWCKRMDATTYQDPVVVNYINKKYYAVKFDAETKDTIRYQNKNAAPGTPESQVGLFVYKPEYKANEFALAILNGQMGYPTTVFMNEKFEILSPVPGYLNIQFMEAVLKYYGEDAYKAAKWEDFQKEFKGEAK